MRLALSLHPDFPGPADTRIEVEVARPGPLALELTYGLTGRIADLAIPPVATSARADELWRHTCFEAFIRPTPGEAYVELNFAPSTQWAAYRFTGYREGMARAEIAPPRLEVRATEGRLTLAAALDLAAMRTLAGDPWRLALSAVIEDHAGAKSYWALAHPSGRPDFHHAAGFVTEL
jgi:hypothetical protein